MPDNRLEGVVSCLECPKFDRSEAPCKWRIGGNDCPRREDVTGCTECADYNTTIIVSVSECCGRAVPV